MTKFCVDCEFYREGFPVSPTPNLCNHPKVAQIDTVTKQIQYMDCRLMRMAGQECGTFGKLYQEKKKEEITSMADSFMKIFGFMRKE